MRLRYALIYARLLAKRLHVIIPLLVLYVLSMPELWAVLIATSLWWIIIHYPKK